MGRGDLTDAEWERLRRFLPVSNNRCGRWRDHRQVIDGILHRVRTGVHWRDLPTRFGPWKTVYERRQQWSADVTWRLLRQVQAAADAAGGIDWDMQSTPPSCVRISMRPLPVMICRRRAPRGSNKQNTGRDALADPARQAGGGGEGGEGLGHSRGGFTSKLHPVRRRALSLAVPATDRRPARGLHPVSKRCRRRSASRAPARAGRAASPTVLPRTRHTATVPAAGTCGVGVSGTR
jgi:transposase